jgi:hypothetical protein
MFTPPDGFKAAQSARLDASAEEGIGKAPRPAEPRTALPRRIVNRERLAVLVALTGFWAWAIHVAAHIIR